MSAADFSRRVAKALTEKREAALQISSAVCYGFAQVGENGAVVPPQRCEDIAMRVIEANALARAYQHAIAIVDEIYREMTAPDKTGPKVQREAPYQ